MRQDQKGHKHLEQCPQGLHLQGTADKSRRQPCRCHKAPASSGRNACYRPSKGGTMVGSGTH